MRRARPSIEELAEKYTPALRPRFERIAETPERDSRATAEYHAAADRFGLPQPPRHRGITLPDNAPDAWEVDGE